MAENSPRKSFSLETTADSYPESIRATNRYVIRETKPVSRLGVVESEILPRASLNGKCRLRANRRETMIASIGR